MGGNAIKSSRRFAANEYRPMADKVLTLLKSMFPGRRVSEIKAYRTKESFGDMDVLLESDNLPGGWREAIADSFRSVEVVPNGPVTSFEFGGLQVDVILTPSRIFDFSLEYFSWNDLGNLIGRVAHNAGFKFGHKGLLYVLRDDTHLIKELTVTDDFDEALKFLGYSPARHWKGFDTIEEIFEYTASSKYFDPEDFPLEHRSHTARVRDAKRKTYQEFLRWVNGREFKVRPRPTKEDWLNLARIKYPVFAYDMDLAVKDHMAAAEAHSRFNGDIVSSWTGLEGIALGALMAVFRKHFKDKKEMVEFILNSSDAELRARVDLVWTVINIQGVQL